MNKQNFLEILKINLQGLPPSDISDIIRDQEEYINDAIQAGRSEENVIASLGDPKEFAANLRATTRISKAEESQTLTKKAKATTSAVLAVLALAPLNIILLLGPFMTLVGILMGGWTLAGAMFIAALAIIGVVLFKLLFLSIGLWLTLSALFLVLGLIGTGVLGIFIMYKATELMIRMTISYLKWNVSFIQQQA